MVVYTVTRAKSVHSAKTTLHVEGRVNAANWDKLREFCLDALKNSDNLVLHLDKVSECDFPLGIFVCLLRRTVSLLGKQLTVHGRQEEFFCPFEETLESRAKRCSFTKESACCLGENLFTRTFVGQLSNRTGWERNARVTKSDHDLRQR